MQLLQDRLPKYWAYLVKSHSTLGGQEKDSTNVMPITSRKLNLSYRICIFQWVSPSEAVKALRT